jgi:hypothetical protein
MEFLLGKEAYLELLWLEKGTYLELLWLMCAYRLSCAINLILKIVVNIIKA